MHDDEIEKQVIAKLLSGTTDVMKDTITSFSDDTTSSKTTLLRHSQQYNLSAPVNDEVVGVPQLRQDRRNLLFFGRLVICYETSGDRWDTIAILYFLRPFYFRRGGVVGSCDKNCAEVCEHKPCLDDFEVYDKDSCRCLNNPTPLCPTNQQCTTTNGEDKCV